MLLVALLFVLVAELPVEVVESVESVGCEAESEVTVLSDEGPPPLEAVQSP